MALEVIDEYELEKIRAEIQQERQMKEMLEQSATELKATVEELEKRYDTIDNEGNEWKTRFETQQEINEQLDKQIIALQEKVDEAKRNLKEAKDAAVAAKEANRGRAKNSIFICVANPHMVRMLEKEKQMLSNQLRDIEWRIDQESKAYHKANDERKQYSVEINATQVNMSDSQARQKALNSSRAELEPIPGSKTPRDMSRNIPEDQRILDPKKGPIRKTAAVKSLPSLEMT
ncbi:hypothetical protein KUTeg_024419 [Tegillarca granosa]|uniref:Coiled-coil domain-containing protein 169 n=1 Tax=Tegillarca granosa TaxID=220873 RepID=A0ABQ9DXA7_TEGGR|nr:hypothetical protein KUTeg_024419 [Tegillarca granosa]